MLRGSLLCVMDTTPAEVEVRLVLGPPNCGELVALNASARNCTLKRSCTWTALNRERSAFGTLGGRMVGNSPLSTRSTLLGCWMKAGCKVWPLKVQLLCTPVVRITHVLKNFVSSPLGNAGLIPVDRKPLGAPSGKPFSRMKTPLACQPFTNTARMPFVWLKSGIAQLPLITMRFGVSWPANVRSGVWVMGSWAFSQLVALSHFARV